MQSNLSPKYIGFSPTNIASDDQVRTTRRRNHAAASSPALSREGESDAAASPLRSTTQLLMTNYMSPIDKLLLKNGANSPNSTGFEADAEDITTQPSRKQLKRKLKRGPKLKPKLNQELQPAAVEAMEAEQEPNVDENSVKIEPIEAVPTEETFPTAIIKTEEEINPKKLEEPKFEQQSEQSTMQDQDLQFAAQPTATSTEMDLIKSPTDNNSEQSMKSPSSISIDSAKGSSIVTDPGWTTYQVGDLYWGKLFTYCYWPCMVCPDEFGQIVGNNPQQHPQRKSTDSAQGQTVPIQVHVRFFADNGRHNWIKSENLMPFAGLKAFEEMREEVRTKHGSKSVKYRQMVAKQNKVMVWRQAIDEAVEVAQMPYDQRLKKFFEIHEKAL